jgi:predicted nucleic acid-binding protein
MSFMKEAKEFIDTNILVYAFDTSAGRKHDIAKAIVTNLWESGNGLISTQVLQEFFVTVTKKIARPVEISVAREIIKDLLQWKPIAIDGPLVLEAIDIHRSHNYSFWDSLIVASAREGGAAVLITEDLADRQQIKGILIRNPFAD